ncbi:hypothetical protein CWI38_0257p0020 [Hamiltosporidium tvaerminnensis]|uniref:Uncharacterized protein n=1 Tax=Hamiltosporidium tvaerminnensis TaxID=1176355 RepID=A0A4Q9M048_9MICR|nr:hypothetical protein CWI38_0257p0020 [Hamiltosporidium tvaerminnensis]
MRKIKLKVYDKFNKSHILNTYKNMTVGETLNEAFPESDTLVIKMVTKEKKFRLDTEENGEFGKNIRNKKPMIFDSNDEELKKTFKKVSKNYKTKKTSSKYIYRFKIIERNTRIEEILKEIIFSGYKFRFYLVDTEEFIEIYVNTCVRYYSGGNRSYKIYCSENTTVDDIENEMAMVFNVEKVFGLFGYNHLGLFKLKKNEKVLVIKELYCIAESNFNFFQLQFKNVNDALLQMKPIYSARFYKLQTKNDILLFKCMKEYGLVENALFKIYDNGRKLVLQNIDQCKVFLEKYYGKFLLIIEDGLNELILCNYDEEICEQMYFSLLGCKNKSLIREIAGNEVKNVSFENSNYLETSDKFDLSFQNSNSFVKNVSQDISRDEFCKREATKVKEFQENKTNNENESISKILNEMNSFLESTYSTEGTLKSSKINSDITLNISQQNLDNDFVDKHTVTFQNNDLNEISSLIKLNPITKTETKRDKKKSYKRNKIKKVFQNINHKKTEKETSSTSISNKLENSIYFKNQPKNNVPRNFTENSSDYSFLLEETESSQNTEEFIHSYFCN